ncbi:MAG: hypothetical protein K9L66_03605, partial [Spirochaetaceae bacterium]|nr:hypothetical protein [Spirochaetaceae bacterium]MCF7950739.1 hypothetical protein [Spirochaetaceae bacterium]
MPDLQDLEQLKADLINLGSEPTVLNRRGQSIPEIHPPEEEQDQELADLLEGFGEEFDQLEEEEPLPEPPPETAAPEEPEEPQPEEPEAEEPEAGEFEEFE